jgi:hypothetical protein
MGGVPPSHNTVILLCAVSFLLIHDPDLNIFSHFFAPYFRSSPPRRKAKDETGDKPTVTLAVRRGNLTVPRTAVHG